MQIQRGIARRGAQILAIAGVLLMASTAVGCSSVSDGANAGQGKTDQAVIDAAAQALKAASTNATTLPQTKPLSGSVAGKKIVYLEAGFQTANLIGDRLVQAAGLLGMHVQRINIGLTPDTVAQGASEAVRLKPDAVMIVGFGPEFYQEQAKALTAAGIPIVGLGYYGCDTVRIKCTGNQVPVLANTFGPPEGDAAGKLMASKVIVDSKGAATVAYFGAPDLTMDQAVRGGFKSTIGKCAGCTVDYVDIQAQSIGTDLPSQIVSYLQSHPKTKWIAAQYGDLLIGVPEALKAAGISGVRIVSQSDSAAQFEDMEAGGPIVMDVPAAYGYLAYESADIIARALLKQPIDPKTIPQPERVLTKGDVDLSDAGYYPGVVGYQDLFKKLWTQ
ncbi:substrate-binding domain-containing protein [Sinomonas humi]|uniref:Periplasmic binding protein domain-containing protein n=1 Tax=Sinomonas humi TaxID=1338436 RepID=A0A0B2AKY2_9MICC|nr:substrate-binding domain-containing protein [Sinomonas humi]KHL02471.1 hypothetical protein LK10_12845 [Sinomonas humi]